MNRIISRDSAWHTVTDRQRKSRRHDQCRAPSHSPQSTVAKNLPTCTQGYPVYTQVHSLTSQMALWAYKHDKNAYTKKIYSLGFEHCTLGEEDLVDCNHTLKKAREVINIIYMTLPSTCTPRKLSQERLYTWLTMILIWHIVRWLWNGYECRRTMHHSLSDVVQEKLPL